MPLFQSTLVFFACAATACAGSFSFTIEGAADRALKHHPGLVAARFRIEEAKGRLQQSGRLSNPELELDFTRNTASAEGSAGVAFVQRLPITSRLRHEKAVSRAELAAATAEVRDAERKVAAETRTAAVRLLALAGQRALRTEQLANTRELADFLLSRVAAGEAAQVEAAQVTLESQQIEIETIALAAEAEVLTGELRPLLGIAMGEVTISGSLPAPAALPDRDPSDRPDIAAAEARAEAARSVVLEQQARRWEDISIGASYTRDRTLDEPGPLETDQIVGFRFALPLPIWNSNTGRIREAQAAALRADRELEAARLNARAETTGAAGAMRAYARLLGALETKLLPAALEIESQLRTNYSTGQTPLVEVLRARARRLELQRQRLDALRDYHLARVRHLAALGQPVTSNQ